jgi:pSer/pThr/pTyr-binding forkhead associated (FHA) protein
MKVLQDYFKDCTTIDPEEFRRRHGDAFLLYHGSLDALTQPTSGPEATMLAENPLLKEKPQPQRDFLVFTVHRRGAAGPKKFISVGRAEKNDVAIPDMSLSIFHAFFTQHADGRFLLQDAGSKNGTFIDDRAVPAQAQGPAMPVQDGALVRFGQVELTFLGAAGFYNLAKRLAD